MQTEAFGITRYMLHTQDTLQDHMRPQLKYALTISSFLFLGKESKFINSPFPVLRIIWKLEIRKNLNGAALPWRH